MILVTHALRARHPGTPVEASCARGDCSARATAGVSRAAAGGAELERRSQQLGGDSGALSRGSCAAVGTDQLRRHEKPERSRLPARAAEERARRRGVLSPTGPHATPGTWNGTSGGEGWRWRPGDGSGAEGGEDGGWRARCEDAPPAALLVAPPAAPPAVAQQVAEAVKV
jgi:hypothetical protein